MIRFLKKKRNKGIEILKSNYKPTRLLCEISGFHGGKYKDDCLLGCQEDHPDDAGSKHL
jgi:hypothetical protein